MQHFDHEIQNKHTCLTMAIYLMTAGNIFLVKSWWIELPVCSGYATVAILHPAGLRCNGFAALHASSSSWSFLIPLYAIKSCIMEANRSLDICLADHQFLHSSELWPPLAAACLAIFFWCCRSLQALFFIICCFIQNIGIGCFHACRVLS